MPLSTIEKKYCRCILKVAAKQYPRYNPYAVCTASVYRGQKRGKIVKCGEYYLEQGLENIPEDQLRAYAKMKKIQGAATMSRSALIDKLYAYITKEYSGPTRNVWIEFLRQYKRDHPSLSHKEAIRKASIEYNKAKSKLR